MFLKRSSWGATLLAFGFCGLFPLFGQTVVNDGFEDGTLQGWGPFGSVTLTNSTAAAHSGTHSLLTTNRTAGFMGPSLNVLPLLTPGATYQVTAWVRLVGGTPATQLNITVKRTPNGGSTQFDSVVSSSATGVNDSSWTQLSGMYTYNGSVSELTLYFQAPSAATASFYVDDITITSLSGPPGPPPNTTGLTSTFEDGSPDGWVPRIGDEVLTVTTADAHSGTHSLLTTNRTHPFTGPAFDVTNVMFNGSQYDVSVWVKMAPGSPTTPIRVSLQQNLGTTTNFFTVVGNTNVSADQWTQLSTRYNVTQANNQLILYVESGESSSATSFASFYIDDVQVTYVPPPQIQQNLTSLFQTLAPFFPMGAEVDTGTIAGVHGQLLAKHFNSIVSGNDMKWDATEPTEGNFSFTNADAEVAFAQAHNMKIRGHNFVWHNQIPAWVFLDAQGNPMTPTPANKALLLQRLRNHIMGVGSHFGNAIYAWDVVNEAIDPAQPDCMRRSPWFLITGKDYIDVAFQTARQVVPNAKLFYNDFSTTDTGKLGCIFNLVADLKSRGIPIDGVGHQMHINLHYPGTEAVLNAVNLLATLGIDQQVTEMDISVGANFVTDFTNYSAIPAEVFNEQGYEYRDYFNVFRQLRGKLSAVTTWGLADDNTWLDTGTVVDAPLIFDQGLQAKPAYWGIIDPTQLAGNALTASIASKTGSQNARVWTITMSNPGPGTATSVEITGFALTQTAGAACTPIVTAPGAFPIMAGSVAAGSSTSVPFTIDFTGCSSLARFTLSMPFDSVLGANTGTLVRNNEFR